MLQLPDGSSPKQDDGLLTASTVHLPNICLHLREEGQQVGQCGWNRCLTLTRVPCSSHKEDLQLFFSERLIYIRRWGQFIQNRKDIEPIGSLYRSPEKENLYTTNRWKIFRLTVALKVLSNKTSPSFQILITWGGKKERKKKQRLWWFTLDMLLGLSVGSQPYLRAKRYLSGPTI